MTPAAGVNRDVGGDSELIYLDSNATTATAPGVVDRMVEVLRSGAGNAGSAHLAGRRARQVVSEAREQVADLLGCSPGEIVFTSGATESNNLALKGLAAAAAGRDEARCRVVSCVTEHPSVLEPLGQLAAAGWPVTLLPVDRAGLLDVEALRAAAASGTLVVSVMAANNETGTVAPLAEVGAIAADAGALVHCDATQLLAWQGVPVRELGIDLVSMSAHKMHGPQGVGALYVSRRVRRRGLLTPLLSGGGQEGGLRSGTVNVAGVAGFGMAAEFAARDGWAAADRIRGLRDVLWEGLRTAVPTVTLNGHPTRRLPGTLNVSFPGRNVAADAVMARAPQVAMSTGSACSSAVPGPSHVLTAMGLPAEEADSALRLSLSRSTTSAEVARAARLVANAVLEVAAAAAEVPA